MSRHFATVGTPSKRLVDYAIENIVIKGRTTAGPGTKWVNNLKNFQFVVDAIKKFRIDHQYQATKAEMYAARDLQQFGWRLIPTHLSNDDINQLNCCISIGSTSLANEETHLLSKNEPNRSDSCRDVVVALNDDDIDDDGCG